MRVLHTITGLSRKSGGTSSCTYHLVRALNEKGCATDLLTSAGTLENPLVGSGEFIKEIPAHFHTPFAYSREMRHALDLSSGYDLIHTNGLWLDLNYYSCIVARRRGLPYIISPHGMLYPQALAVKPWRKRIMRLLCFNRLLREAACIHVTCEENSSRTEQEKDWFSGEIPSNQKLAFSIESMETSRRKNQKCRTASYRRRC